MLSRPRSRKARLPSRRVRKVRRRSRSPRRRANCGKAIHQYVLSRVVRVIALSFASPSRHPIAIGALPGAFRAHSIPIIDCACSAMHVDASHHHVLAADSPRSCAARKRAPWLYPERPPVHRPCHRCHLRSHHLDAQLVSTWERVGCECIVLRRAMCSSLTPLMSRRTCCRARSSTRL